MSLFDSNRQNSKAALLLSISLVGCVGPQTLRDKGLEGYNLPKISGSTAPKGPVVPFGELAPAGNAESEPSRETRKFSDAATSPLGEGRDALASLGIQFGLNSKELGRFLNPIKYHDLLQTQRVAGTSSAGVFEAKLQDTVIDEKEPQETVRAGKVSGSVEGFMGIRFPASGEFRLKRMAEYDTLSFQLRNSAIARLDAQFIQLHSDPSQCYFGFSVTPGLLAGLFGVPETDTVINVPIRIKPSGVMHLHFDDDDAKTLVDMTATALEDNSALDRKALEDALKISAPLSLYGYEAVPELNPSFAAVREPIPTLINDTYRASSAFEFPKITLSFDQKAGAETMNEIDVVAVSANHVYFAFDAFDGFTKKSFVARYQSIKEILPESNLFVISLAELGKHLLPDTD